MPNIVKEQIYQLRSVTNQLKMAHKGQDVEWWDRELERRDKSSTSTFEGSGDDGFVVVAVFAAVPASLVVQG
jgi:hypothetical protein